MTEQKKTTQTKKTPKKSLKKAVIDGERMGARRAIVEEMFNDMYDDRVNIYKMNFVRGLFFGFGSVLGGTLLVAITIAVLGQFVDWFPVLGDFINGILDAMSRPRR